MNSILKNKKKGFTLIELLIVVSIIGLLSSIVIVNVNSARDKARVNKTVAYSQQIYRALGADAVGAWDFNEGSGNVVADMSSNKNNGTLGNGSCSPGSGYCPQWAEGLIFSGGTFGKALSFDGSNDYVALTDKDMLSFGNGAKDYPFTILAWININDAADTNKAVLSKWNAYGGTQKEYIFFRRGEYGLRQLDFMLYDYSTLAAIERYSETVQLSGWQLVGAVYDGRGGSTAADGMALYLNGNMLSSTAINNANYVSMENGNLQLRAGNDSGGYFSFNGIIDEVYLYSKALTSAQIQQHYTEGLGRHQDLAEK